MKSLGGTEEIKESRGTLTKSLGGTEEFQSRGTPTKTLDGDELLATDGILTSLGKFKLDSRETSVVPRKLKPIAKALNSQASHVTFNFLGENEKLKLIPRGLVSTPPSMTYGKIVELIDLVRDWEFGETLVVNGCFIPLQYWQALYKEHFPLMWALIKVNWSNWRVRDLTFQGIPRY